MTDRPTYEELETRVKELEQADFERRQADQALREANLLLEGVLDALPDIVGIQKPDHTIVRYNKAGYEALNLTHEEVFGKSCFNLLGRTAICEKCATAQALKSKKLETVEQFSRNSAGTICAGAIPCLTIPARFIWSSNNCKISRSVSRRRRSYGTENNAFALYSKAYP